MNDYSNDTFAGKSHKFLSWFKAQPGAFFHPDLEVSDLRFRNAGRGIVATADIPADTELFVIPRGTILTTLNSSLHKQLSGIFSANAGSDGDLVEDQEPLDPWLALIIALLYEHFHAQDSPWKPYLAMLPSSFETLMFWSEAELSELQASAIRHKVGREAADDMFRKFLLPLVRKHEAAFFPGNSPTPSDAEIVGLAHRMGSTIMAYAFDLERDEDEAEAEDGWVEDREGQALGMVPMADMLNADAEFNAHLNHGDESLTMTALRTIRKGEEVLNYYGPLPNSDLLRRYGYTTPKHGMHDVVEMSWDAVKKAAKVVSQLDDLTLKAVLEQLDPDDLEESFVLERDPIEPDSTGMLPDRELAVTALPEDLVMQVRRFVKAAKRAKPDAFQAGDAAMLAIISESLTARLREYRTSIADDELLLRDAAGRRRMAIEVRLGEKKVLRDVIAFVDGRRAQVAEDEPRVKRQKVS